MPSRMCLLYKLVGSGDSLISPKYMLKYDFVIHPDEVEDMMK